MDPYLIIEVYETVLQPQGAYLFLERDDLSTAIFATVTLSVIERAVDLAVEA